MSIRKIIRIGQAALAVGILSILSVGIVSAKNEEKIIPGKLYRFEEDENYSLKNNSKHTEIVPKETSYGTFSIVGDFLEDEDDTEDKFETKR